MKKFTFIFYCILLALIPVLVSADTYYSRATASGGGDGTANNDTDAWTWQELKNNTTVADDDIVYLYGSYSIDLDTLANRLAFNSNGSDGHPIIYDGTNATITITGCSSTFLYVFNFSGDSYLTFQNFTIATGGGISEGPNIATSTSTSTHIVFGGNDFTGDFAHGFYNLIGADDWTIKNGILEQTSSTITVFRTNSSGNGISIRDADTFNIHNMRFSNWGHSAIEAPAQAGQTVQYLNIYYCYFSAPNNDAYGSYPIALNEDGGTVQYVYFHHNKAYSLRNELEIAEVSYFYAYGNEISYTENCCEGLATGCDYAETDGSCSTGTYSYYKIGYGFFFLAPNDHVYLWNNTLAYIAEGCFFIQTNPGASSTFRFYNNVLYNCAMTSDEFDSPEGSHSENGTDYAVGFLAANTPTDVEFENNIVDTNAGSTSANGDTYWGGTARTIAAFDAAYAWASNNEDVSPGFKSATELWPDSPSDALVESGRSISVFAALPMYNQLLDPALTDFEQDPPVVYTKDQPTTPNIGAWALEGGSVSSIVNSGIASGLKINQ